MMEHMRGKIAALTVLAIAATACADLRGSGESIVEPAVEGIHAVDGLDANVSDRLSFTHIGTDISMGYSRIFALSRLNQDARIYHQVEYRIQQGETGVPWPYTVNDESGYWHTDELPTYISLSLECEEWTSVEAATQHTAEEGGERAYGTSVADTKTCGDSGGGPGGGDGDDDDEECRTYDIILEESYDGGNTWHVVAQRRITVCS